MLLYFAVAAFLYLLIYKYLHSLLIKLDKMSSIIWTNKYSVSY